MSENNYFVSNFVNHGVYINLFKVKNKIKTENEQLFLELPETSSTKASF